MRYPVYPTSINSSVTCINGTSPEAVSASPIGTVYAAASPCVETPLIA